MLIRVPLSYVPHGYVTVMKDSRPLHSLHLFACCWSRQGSSRQFRRRLKCPVFYLFFPGFSSVSQWNPLSVVTSNLMGRNHLATCTGILAGGGQGASERARETLKGLLRLESGPLGAEKKLLSRQGWCAASSELKERGRKDSVLFWQIR